MREILIGESTLSHEAIRPLTCEYHILVNSISEPVLCESYGIQISIQTTGEREAVHDITVLPERIWKLAELLIRNVVTPCTLKEVIEDWI